jgi:nitrous oxidase accessory protein NosD
MRMLLKSLGITLVFALAVLASAQMPEAGMIIKKSARLKGGTYTIPSLSTDPYTGVITIEGDNITVDFKGVTLMGTPESAPPDERKGTAIRVNGKNVTVKNAKVRGYMIGLIAKDSPGLKILDSDFSYNYKQHLKSGLERENEDDWQYYHQNEKNEWLRYGAGIYLNGCEGFEVKNCTITGGQCGLMLVGSNKGIAWNNNFIFLSGIGVGLYRSSENRILANSLDWCVRGYSHGYYSRGQDSAAILVYEQSNKNIFAYNSATHSGDGFFLWAGQTTMDTGEGGCNDNFVYGNDFSFAPANGIETTFSRNTFANNMAQGCDYGVWGGYSYDSKYLGNWLLDNRVGLAIEHGQDNVIRGNYLMRDLTAVQLWANAIQDSSWGYPKHRDTDSHGYDISNNIISRSNLTFDIRNTVDVKVTGNRITFPGTLAKEFKSFTFEDNRIAGMATPPDGLATKNTFDQVIEAGLAPDWDPFAKDKDYPAELRAIKPEMPKGSKDMFTGNWIYPGRINIIVDEWGPYDFQFPKLWPYKPEKQSVEDAGRVPDKARSYTQTFRVMGPPGTWLMKSSSGVTDVPQKGDVPGEISVTVPSEQATAINLDLIYTSTLDVVDYLGVKHAAGKEVSFGYKQFFAPITWTVNLFAWDEATDPRTKEDAFFKLIAGKPLHTATLNKLQFATSGPFFPGKPADRFATVSNGSVDLPEGSYDLEVTSDDGCRVWIDGKKVIDEWHYQAPTTYTVSLSGGKHNIKVQHFEIDGHAALVVEVKQALNGRLGA